jgi:hypothetical protein
MWGEVAVAFDGLLSHVSLAELAERQSALDVQAAGLYAI